MMMVLGMGSRGGGVGVLSLLTFMICNVLLAILCKFMFVFQMPAYIILIINKFKLRFFVGF